MLSPDEERIRDEAVAFARANRKRIAKRMTDPQVYAPESDPVSVFMAGSPGAGKTEASLELIDRFPDWSILRIDPDELRCELPGYQGSNSWLFQSAVPRLVDAVLDRAFTRDLSFVLDGTFSSFDVARKNVDRSLRGRRRVQVLYVYQHPLLAWGFVQERERKEGRRILPEHFIEQYFGARDVVNRLKEEYGTDFHVDLLMKNIDNSHRFYRAGVDRIDSHIPECVTRDELEKALRVL